MAAATARPAQGGEGADSGERRAGTAAAGVAVGPGPERLPVYIVQWREVARGPVSRPIAAACLSPDVRARLQSGVPVMLGDRRRVQWNLDASRASRRDAG